ncbi:hypothetical protein J2S03_000823 [Alicyclobacillus cycloheptanicus]|uniref:Uncharacterized protein n=1 Tax=Alicyclobacillus cycloheptanicus TaxID=1457 RepID=A0ABT9XFD6_9BACL|nr:hypothetical protein [Alicyclobacillus cycloheptanicus]
MFRFGVLYQTVAESVLIQFTRMQLAQRRLLDLWLHRRRIGIRRCIDDRK